MLQNNPRLKRLSAQQRENLVEFVTGNMLFVLLHELAHAAIDDFELPVLGRDEDAADDYAVMRTLIVGNRFRSGSSPKPRGDGSSATAAIARKASR